MCPLQIKELGLRLIELRSVMIDQEIDFANVVCFIDAASEDFITQEKALSSRFLNKVILYIYDACHIDYQ